MEISLWRVDFLPMGCIPIDKHAPAGRLEVAEAQPRCKEPPVSRHSLTIRVE